MKHLLSISDLDRDEIIGLMDEADRFREALEGREIKKLPTLRGRTIYTLFYENSTRTRSSFETAGKWMSADVINLSASTSSVKKGESLKDTALTLASIGADAIIMRHPSSGAAQLVADWVAPGGVGPSVINAGDGSHQHPTQALLDLFTIYEELGGVDGLKVAMVGDLRYGRTVHSLTRLLLQYNVSLRFVSPDTLRLPLNLMNTVIDSGINVRESDNVQDVIGDADVLYVTRIQKERFGDAAAYDEVKDAYEITPALMRQAKEKMVIMHPLPRVGEIHTSVDADPRAAYFRQVQNGMFIRMALLAAVLGKA